MGTFVASSSWLEVRFPYPLASGHPQACQLGEPDLPHIEQGSQLMLIMMMVVMIVSNNHNHRRRRSVRKLQQPQCRQRPSVLARMRLLLMFRWSADYDDVGDDDGDDGDDNDDDDDIYVMMKCHENINAPVFSQDETVLDVQVIHWSRWWWLCSEQWGTMLIMMIRWLDQCWSCWCFKRWSFLVWPWSSLGTF